MDRGAWWATVHGFAKSWTRERLTLIPQKKNILGVKRQQLKSIANRSLSGNLLVVSEADSELASITSTGGVFTPYAAGSLPEKVRECPKVPET